MHKKNKGKNKQKNPNPTPPQQVAAPVKESEPKKEEERVPEILPELVLPALDYQLNAGPLSQTPAKPKRHRAGKKRKQNENKEDNVENEEAIESVPEVKATEGENNLSTFKKESVKVETLKGEPKKEVISSKPLGVEDKINLTVLNEETTVKQEIPINIPEKETSKPEDQIKDAIPKKVVDPLVQGQTVTPAARKKKGKANKSDPEKAIVTAKDVLQTQPIKEEFISSIEENPIEKCPTPVPEILDKIVSSEPECKLQEINIESKDGEQKGGKKKNKKNQKANIEPIIVQDIGKHDHNIEKPVQKPEIQSHSEDNEESLILSKESGNTDVNIEKPVPKLEVIKPKTEAKKEESQPKKPELKMKEIIEPVKLEEQNIYELKHEHHEHEANKGKKKNKKEKRAPQEQHANTNIDVIIEEAPSETRLEKIAQDAPSKASATGLTKQDISKQLAEKTCDSKEKTIKVESTTESKERIMEQVPFDTPVKEVSSDIQQITPEALPVTVTEDNNNNMVRDEATPITEEVIITDFEKLLSEEAVTETPKDETLPKDAPISSKTEREITDFAPLSESNIDESCKKLFEALLVTGKPTIPQPIIEKCSDPTPTQIETKKEEDFIVRLFDKPIISRPPPKHITSKVNKPESTDVKGKMLEVNKDMEDLKLSIEKSLAELTALESDDMPELVAITECETPPSEVKKEEATAIVNVKNQIVPVPKESLQRPVSPKITETADAKLLSIETLDMKVNIAREKCASEISGAEIDKPEEIAIDPQHKKHKGKGKSSKPQEPSLIVNLEMKENTPRSVSPMILNVTMQSESGIKTPEPVTTATDATTDVQEHQSQTCSQDQKGKGKGKNKKKNKAEQAVQQTITTQGAESQPAEAQASSESQKTDTTKTSEADKAGAKETENEKGKKAAVDQKSAPKDDESVINKKEVEDNTTNDKLTLDKVENFEDALTSSIDDDTNQFEDIDIGNRKASSESSSFVIPIEKGMFETQGESEATNKPIEEKKQVENPLSTRSKNLLGHPDIPVTSSRSDYKKEKNKNVQTPNAKHARIKIKDSVEIESNEAKKCSKQSQTENKVKSKRQDKSSTPESENEDEYVYKYSFRKVSLTNSCHICKAELKGRRISCGYCNLIFYCSQKHKDEDWPQHQALCFAVSTIVHLKGLKFIYEDAKGVSGQDYRLLRMQVIVSCEKILKRKLLPCEQEALLYPRLCSNPACREWKTSCLTDCQGCGLVSHCTDKPQHLMRDHQMWCRSYRLYFKLVTHQQSKGRLEPKLPSKVISDIDFGLPDKINELLAHVYEEKIDLDDVHYAALTQLATAPLTAAYSHQLYKNSLPICADITNGHQDKTFTLHVVGAELQFEADTLHKWEVFFLHLRPDIQELRVVFVGPELNPSKLPLDLLAKIKMCKQCRQDKRKILFDYQDGQLYHTFLASKHFTRPDIVCAFNPGLHRITGFGGVDSWPETINCIIKQNVPFCVTSYTKYELPRDLIRIRECSNYQYKIILEPTLNPYASIRPDRNFISDDEMPLIFKNYYLMVLCGLN